MHKKLFVANHKMQLSFHQEIDFVTTNLERISTLACHPEVEFVLCPTFTELYAIILSASDTRLHIGAQNVSSFASGAHTGQVSATSLAEIGCTFCIIGHSDTRTYETNEDIAKKCEQLFSQSIIPIICIGEPQEVYAKEQTLAFLEQQLKPVFQTIEQAAAEQEYVIAYEPIWAIGSGNIPTSEYLSRIFSHLHTLCASFPQSFRLLYGGSVNPENVAEILKISHINGALIGNASLHIDLLEAIINEEI